MFQGHALEVNSMVYVNEIVTKGPGWTSGVETVSTALADSVLNSCDAARNDVMTSSFKMITM